MSGCASKFNPWSDQEIQDNKNPRASVRMLNDIIVQLKKKKKRLNNYEFFWKDARRKAKSNTT